jgi:hypothetical protein
LCTTPDRDLDSGGDGADGFAAFAAGQDGGALVVVDQRSAAAGAAAFAGGFEPVVGLADDVSAPVFGEGEGQVDGQKCQALSGEGR